MPFSRASILRRVLTYPHLPTLSEVMQRILEVVEDEGSSANDLTRILESDPAITARVLKLANSSFYGCRYHVESLQRAVVLVGFETVKQLALATGVVNALHRKPQRVLDPVDLWLHSLGAAKAAQLLAIATGHGQSAPVCFTAALLHDIGKYVLSLTLGGEYEAVSSDAIRNELRLVDVEQQRLGVDHAELGGMLLAQWGLPSLITTAIKFQYTPELYQGPRQLEVAIVAVSSEISRVSGFGNGGDVGPLRLPAYSLRGSGLTGEAVGRTIQELPNHQEEAEELLQVFRESRGPER